MFTAVDSGKPHSTSRSAMGSFERTSYARRSGIFGIGLLMLPLAWWAARWPARALPSQEDSTAEPATRAAALTERIDAAEQAGQYAAGIDNLRDLVALLEKSLGPEHWQTIDARLRLKLFHALNNLSAEERQGFRNALSAANAAQDLLIGGRAAQAEEHLRRFMVWCERILGQDDPVTAVSYNDLAIALNAQRKSAEAERYSQKALEIRVRLLGDRHPETATSYSHLATELRSQGRHADALPFSLKALDVRRAALGSDHAETINDLNNLGVNLQALGQFAQAQPCFQTALERVLRAETEYSERAALAFHNLAANLAAQGKYAEATPFFQRALDLRAELLGEGHADSIDSHLGLAANLVEVERFDEAQKLYDRALELSQAHDEGQGVVASNCHSAMGRFLYAQRRYDQAGPHLRTAHEINLVLLTERHPLSIRSLNNLAANLDAQYRHAEAQPLLERALELCRQILGEDHPDTAACTNNLAVNLLAQGQIGQARAVARAAALSFEAARAGAARSGFERAIFGAERSPYRLLAVCEAKGGAPIDAWNACEADLARGLSESSFVSRIGDHAHAADSREQEIAANLARIQPRLLTLASIERPGAALREELGLLRQTDRELRRELGRLAALQSRSLVAPLAEVQAALPENSALITWVDLGKSVVQEHWVCVIRPTGQPAWRQLPGTGHQGAWRAEDGALPAKLREALASRTASAPRIEELASQLYDQRFSPVADELLGVKTLYVVAVRDMAGIPVELLAGRFTICYVPSGTFLARLNQRPPPAKEGLLALADPVFDAPKTERQSQEDLPSGGLVIIQVSPGSAADKAQLKPGDVLLRYSNTPVDTAEDLSRAISDWSQTGAREATILVWRAGAREPLARRVAAGKLGVGLLRKPAPEVVSRRQQSLAMAASAGRGAWRELPATRVELAELSKLFAEQAVSLVESNASEQGLERLRRNGQLETFRYLHLATHGQANDQRAFESLLVLAQDQVAGAALPQQESPRIDGQLTAGEVLQFWKLNADLVTLSACETALGRKAGGDGLLGFAHAFLAAGSRSVCLSLWKVNDSATALLMTRFYQNLLGRRPGLDRPLGKGQALMEAKAWLKELPEAEARELLSAAAKRIPRGNRGKDEVLDLAPPRALEPAEPHSARPFAHPRYWAAFVLVGDPG